MWGREGSKPSPKRGTRKGEEVRQRDWGSPEGEVGVQEGEVLAGDFLVLASL